MSSEHKISSLYNKLTTLKEPELNNAVKNVHRVILTLCRLDPTYFMNIDTAIAFTNTFLSKFLSKLSDDAIIRYIKTPALLQLFHSRYHKDIGTLLLTISNVFPFLLGFYNHIMYALNYLDSETKDQKAKESLFFIIKIIEDFNEVTTDEKVYVIKRIIIMLENIKRNLQNNNIVGDSNVSETEVSDSNVSETEVSDTEVSDTKVSKWLNEVVSFLSGLSTIMPTIAISEQLINDILEYIVKNKDVLNDVLLKIESVGIDTLLDKSITSLGALVNIVEKSKGSVVIRDSRDSVSPAIVTPPSSPKSTQNSSKPTQNSQKASKKGFLSWDGGVKGKTRKTRKTNKRTKKRKPKRKTSK